MHIKIAKVFSFWSVLPKQTKKNVTKYSIIFFVILEHNYHHYHNPPEWIHHWFVDIIIVITKIMINIISIYHNNTKKNFSLNHKLVDALSWVVRLVSISPSACEENLLGWPISSSTGSRNSLTFMSFWTFLFLSKNVASRSGRV